MRKQMKIAAVVSTAALLALGASMTSMAASKGTWKMDDNDWMCYDKNGDAYEATFCLSNGKEYYVGDDGYLVRSEWVDYDGDMYYVNSAGTKVINDWKLLTPYEDEEAEAVWYYFGSTGKRVEEAKKVINNKTYYFHADGAMLTGWVNDDNMEEASSVDKDHTFYCDETGARVQKSWVKTTVPGADEDDEDEFWYYLKSTGKVATGKQGSINGQTYFFDVNGQMLSGWVGKDGSDNYVSVQDEVTDADTLSKLVGDGYQSFYYCSGEDDGHMKKDKWVKLWRNTEADDEDYDNDQYWFYLEKDGSVLLPEVADAASKVKFNDGNLSVGDDRTFESHKINGKEYFINKDGEMLTGLIMDKNSNIFYLGSDGAVKTGSQTINDDNDEAYKFYFDTEDDSKGVALTGNKSGKLYVQGKLVTADTYKYEIVSIEGTALNGKSFIINSNGTIQSKDSLYREDGETLIDAEKDAPTFSTAKDETKGSFPTEEIATKSLLKEDKAVQEITAITAK